MKTLSIHPYANIFPEMNEHEFSALREDIRINGLREPILTYQGKIIDGRNRLKACRELKIEPTTRECPENGSVVALIVSLNFHRRHLTKSQKNAIGVEVEKAFKAEALKRQSEGGKKAGGNRKLPTQPKSNQVGLNSDRTCWQSYSASRQSSRRERQRNLPSEGGQGKGP